MLLVDDRPANLDALEAILRPLDLRLVRATTADEALREVLRNDFAVILLDVKMPGMDGVETARLIKARARSELVPIIFLTALERDRRRVTAAYESGAVDYLTKPLDPAVLRAKVQAFVELHQKRENAAWRQRRRFADLAEEARIAAAREADRRTADILERIGDAHIAVDREWRIGYLNPAAKRLPCLPKPTLLGRTLWEAWPASVGSKADRMYRRAVADQVEVHFAERYVSDSYDVHLEIDAYPTEDRGLAIFCRDVTARVAAEAARRASEERLRLAVEAARIVAWEWDPATERMTTTENMREIYGVSSLDDWAAGSALVHPDDRERHRAAVRAATDAGTSYRSEFRITRPDTGEIVWLEERGATVRDADGRVVRVVGVVVDVTERKRVEAERERLLGAEREARAKAELADRTKSEFLATMSHEFRTPLNAIVGYVQLLKLGVAGPVTAQQQEYLDRLRASGRHLLGLVNDALDLAKIEAGQMTVASDQALAGSAVEAALALAQPDAEARGITVLNRCAIDSRLVYVGDEHRVRQILLNLLSNAVKFTDRRGRIEVECDIAEKAAGTARVEGAGPWLVLRVSDTGIGIAPEQQEAIFGAFHQVDRGTTRAAGGTGLGLAISRRLARLMGGDLTLDSEIGRGSVFSVWLPGIRRAPLRAETG